MALRGASLAKDKFNAARMIASAGLPKLPEFMVYFDATDGPKSLLAHHLASIARDTSAY